jgi:hypothetical protein
MKKQLFILMMMMLTALTAQAAEYGIYIAGTQVTDANKDNLAIIAGVSGGGSSILTYDSETNTLSMKDIFITYEGAALQVTQGELNIAVSGNCYLTSTSGDGLYIDLDTHVTLTGNGVLSVEGQNGVYIGSDYYSYKTQTAKLTVQGPMLLAEGTSSSSRGIRGVDAGSYTYKGELELLYGTIKAKGDKGSICMLKKITVGDNATVTEPEYAVIAEHEVRSSLTTATITDWVTITAAMPDSELPLTIEAIEAGQVSFHNHLFLNIGYSVNDGEITWVNSSPAVYLNAGDKISFYGNNERYANSLGTGDYSTIVTNAECYVYGNVMSLISSDGFSNLRELTKSYTFTYLFLDNTKIKSHPEKRIVLPATKLTEDCYKGMFKGCRALTTPPKLPAMELAVACYSEMFSYCSGLTSAPELPATTLKNDCYNSMFYYCRNLTKSPILPAPKLADRCYYQLFADCGEEFKEVTCLATDISASNCTAYWLRGVSSTGTFYKATNAWSVGVNGIPSGWTSMYDDSKSTCDLAFSTDHLDVTYGEPYETPTLDNPHFLTVTYSSSAPTVATVDASTGALTILKAGTTTITASFAGSADYWPGSASYTLTAVGKGDAPVFAFNREAVLVTYGKTFTAPLLTMSDGLTAKYSVDNTSVATINSTTGKVTIRGKGVATITATTDGNMEYAAASAKYHIAVLENAEKVRCDANADGNVSITDAVTIVNYILGGGASAPAMEEPKELGPEVAPE